LVRLKGHEGRVEIGSAVSMAMGIPDGWAGAEAKWLARNDVHTVVFEGASLALPEVIEDWVQLAPDVVFVVASRLALEGSERLEPLPPSEARELFAARAPRAVDLEAIADVLDRLEGLPLAIELAAARLEVLSVERLRERLAQPLDLLRNPDETGDHATLRRAIAASWRLLEPHEQQAMAQCSVFEAGIPLDGAEAVLVLGPEAPPVLDVLHGLVRRSLLHRLPEGGQDEPRFSTFDVIFNYAREQLSNPQEVEERHSRWLLSQFEEWMDDFFHRSSEATRRMYGEFDNIRAMAGRSAGAGSEERALRAAMALNRGMRHRDSGKNAKMLGREVAGWDNLAAAIERAEAADVGDRLIGRAILECGGNLRLVGRLADAAAEFERCLEISRRCEDRRLEGHALGNLANIRALMNDVSSIEVYYQRALEIGRDLPDPRLEALALTALSGVVDVARDWNHSAALAKRRRAVALIQQVDDVYYEVWLLSRLAQSYLALGQVQNALEELTRALELMDGSGCSEPSVYETLSQLHLTEGRLDAAEEAANHAIQGFLDLYCDTGAHCVPSLQVKAMVALETHRPADAERLLEGAREATGGRRRLTDLAILSAGLLAGARVLQGLDPVLPERTGRVLDVALDFANAMVPIGTDQRGESAFSAARAAVSTLDGVQHWVAIVLRRLAAAHLRRAEARSQSWQVARDGSLFQLPNAESPISLHRRRKLQRLLALLAHAWIDRPGEVVRYEDLMEAAWPGEVHGNATQNRLYVAISNLRKMGLDVVQRKEGGYLLDPDISLVQIPLES